MTAGSQPAPAAHPPRRVSVYIDGFNLYYGSLKGTPYKWLDPYALACALMPSDHVTAVHYFTARVKPTPKNPSVHQRQDVYRGDCGRLSRACARECRNVPIRTWLGTKALPRWLLDHGRTV